MYCLDSYNRETSYTSINILTSISKVKKWISKCVCLYLCIQTYTFQHFAGESFQNEFLDTHNAYRQKHNTASLTLSSALSASAQKWADHLVSIKTLEHSTTDKGENLYFAWSSSPKTLTG